MKLVAKLIKDKIKLLETGRARLEGDSKDKADKISRYEMVLAKTIIQLKNGVEMEIEGQKVKNPPATLIEKIARGICWREKLDTDLAESTYKSTIVKIQVIQSELNAYQSLYKNQIEL